MTHATTALAIGRAALTAEHGFAQRANPQPELHSYVRTEQVLELDDRYEAQKRTLAEWLAQEKCGDRELGSR